MSLINMVQLKNKIKKRKMRHKSLKFTKIHHTNCTERTLHTSYEK